MKKVAIFTCDFYPIFGGQGRHLIELYHRIYKEGNFLIFSPNINNLKNHKTIFKFTTKFGKNLLYSVLLNFKINKLIKEYNLDIIHLHCGPGGIIILKKPKVKFICTVHATYFPLQRYAFFQKWRYFLYILEKRMYGMADKLIAVSEDTKRVLIRHYGILSSKIEFIPNGVDVSKFYPIKNIKKTPKTLLFVGRLEKRKGVNFLIEAVPFIVKKIPDVSLYIIGKGKLENWIKRYIKKNNLEKNISCLGFISDNEKLNKWYNSVECIIIPSNYEGFGFTVIEAMACGTPIIATNVDGIRSIIKNNKNGILVEYNNKKQLATRVVKLLNNHNLREELSTQGLKTVKERFNWDKITKQIIELYKK